MKKIYISLFIFLLLIGISSFAFAANSTIANQVDFSSSLSISVPNCDFDTISTWAKDYLDTNNYDLTNTPYCFAGIYESDQVLVVFYNTYEIDTQGSGSNQGKNFIKFLDYRYAFFFNFSTQKVTAYQNDNSGYTSYTFGSVWYPYQEFATNQDLYLSNGTLLYSEQEYPLIVGGEGGEDDGGEDDGEEDEGGILDFITNFWSNLVHIVVPTSEQWADLQDSWQDDILDKFNIQTWTFSSSSLDYNYTNQWQDSSAPILEFQFMGSTCRIELEYINTLFNMPLSSVLKISKYSDTQTEVGIQYGFNGLTLKNLISFVLAIELTLTNIYLYNKFFNKGGGD